MGIIIEDDRIYIRPYTKKDVVLLHQAVSQSLDTLLPWMIWAKAHYSEKEAMRWIANSQEGWERGSEYDFGVFAKSDRSLLGGVGLNAIFYDHCFANMGYWVRTSMAKQGIATRAARLLCHFAFEYKGFNRIEIVAAKANLGSQRVAEKIPAQREGILRERLMIEGKAQDAIMYSILVTDWR